MRIIQPEMPERQLQDFSELPKPYGVIKIVKSESPSDTFGHLEREFRKIDSKRRFRLGKVYDTEKIPAGHDNSVVEGYHHDVDELDVSKPHTMDLVNFIDIEVSRPVAELMRGGMDVEMHSGTHEETLDSLSRRGYTRYRKVTTPLGPGILVAVNDKSGESAIALPNMYGDDNVQHYQAIAKFLEVPSDKLKTITHDSTYEDTLDGEFEGKKFAPDTFVMGGWIMGKYLEGRARLAKRHGELTSHWEGFRKAGDERPINRIIAERLAGPDTSKMDGKNVRKHESQYKKARETLAAMLETEEADRAFSMPTDHVHRKGEVCDTIYDVTEALNKISKNVPVVKEIPKASSGFAFDKDDGIFIDDVIVEPLKVARLRFEDSRGTEHVMGVSDNPYGDLSGKVSSVLLKREDVKDLMFIGSSGSIRGLEKDDEVAIGDISIPMDVYSAKGDPLNHTVENSLLYHMEDEIKSDLVDRTEQRPVPPVNHSHLIASSHLKVATPLFENTDTVDMWRDTYADTVDVEIGEVVDSLEKAPPKKRPRFGVMTYVEDIIGFSGYTLGETDRKLLERSRTRVVDIMVDYLDIKKILPSKGS